jgi:hypothetical protein
MGGAVLRKEARGGTLSPQEMAELNGLKFTIIFVFQAWLCCRRTHLYLEVMVPFRWDPGATVSKCGASLLSTSLSTSMVQDMVPIFSGCLQAWDQLRFPESEVAHGHICQAICLTQSVHVSNWPPGCHGDPVCDLSTQFPWGRVTGKVPVHDLFPYRVKLSGRVAGAGSL